jgi:cell division septation protein DedD
MPIAAPAATATIVTITAVESPAPPAPVATAPPRPAAAAMVRAFVIEIDALATCEWKEAETFTWKLPGFTGFNPTAVARPA